MMERPAKRPPATQTQAESVSASSRRIAFFGGSFDPPHLGHLAVARAARDALDLDAVLFAPVGAQPLKPQGSTASFADRLAMTRLAIDRQPGFEISLADAPNALGEPNYTVQTLRDLRAALPPGGSLFCLMGADSFVSLSRWRDAAEIPFAASLIVASRPGQQLDDLARYLPQGLQLEPKDTTEHSIPTRAQIEVQSYRLCNPAGEIAPFYLLPDLDVEISASEIRNQVRSDHDPAATQSLLPEPVADYIRTHALYR